MRNINWNLCCYLPVNVGEDCPVFDGLYEFCQLSCGGSIGKEKRTVVLGTVSVVSPPPQLGQSS